MQVRRKLVNNSSAPTMRSLPLENFSSNSPVQHDHSAVDRERSTMAGMTNFAFETAKPFNVFGLVDLERHA